MQLAEYFAVRGGSEKFTPTFTSSRVLGVRLPAAPWRTELMDRNNEGLLTEVERADLESLLELSERRSLVRAEALHLLGRKPV